MCICMVLGLVYDYKMLRKCLYINTCTFALKYTAIANLNGVVLYGNKIHVTLSKHSTVQMPQAGSNVSLLCNIYM